MPKYLTRLPQYLLDELQAGRWLPIVGAGMSANASSASGEKPPTWSQLGKSFSRSLGGSHDDDDPVESISAFEYRFGRPAMIDKLREVLLVDEVKLGDVHRAFGRIPFDSVVTTNFDFLLEEAWRDAGLPFDAIIGSQRLSARSRANVVRLLKFHGDVNHPDDVVATESDYDTFLSRQPLLATYMTNLLITRVPVFMGYSLNDGDFRQIMSVIKDRLGNNAPVSWVILPRATDAEVERYRRRGVQVAVLSGSASADRSTVLRDFFVELAEYLENAASSNLESSDDSLLSELKLLASSSDRLVLFLGEEADLALYRSRIFPVLQSRGYLARVLSDVVGPEGLRLASIRQLLVSAAVVIVDVGEGSSERPEVQMARTEVDPFRLLVVQVRGRERGSWNDRQYILRTAEGLGELEFMTRIVNAVEGVAGSTSRREKPRSNSTRDLVIDRFIRALADHESILRSTLAFSEDEGSPGNLRDVLAPVERDIYDEAVRMRNALNHGAGDAVSSAQLERVTLMLEQFNVRQRSRGE